LHTYSIPLFLSHSTNSNPYEIPQIISNWMFWDWVKSKIELEKGESSIYFEEEKTLEEILREVMENIKELETRLDKIWKKDEND
jgi:hypothetical protein